MSWQNWIFRDFISNDLISQLTQSVQIKKWCESLTEQWFADVTVSEDTDDHDDRDDPDGDDEDM